MCDVVYLYYKIYDIISIVVKCIEVYLIFSAYFEYIFN